MCSRCHWIRKVLTVAVKAVSCIPKALKRHRNSLHQYSSVMFRGLHPGRCACRVPKKTRQANAACRMWVNASCNNLKTLCCHFHNSKIFPPPPPPSLSCHHTQLGRVFGLTYINEINASLQNTYNKLTHHRDLKTNMMKKVAWNTSPASVQVVRLRQDRRRQDAPNLLTGQEYVNDALGYYTR